MRLIITSEHRFSIAADGTVWSKVGNDYAFWQRYLSGFDSVRVVARAQRDPLIDGKYKKVIGPGVEFWPVPYYVGPLQFALRKRQVARSVYGAMNKQDAVVCRVASPIATELLRQIKGRPYGLEVVGDPYEALGPGAVRHPLRPMFRRVMRRCLREQCAGAAGVAYVTQTTLQQRYPCPALSVGVSDVAHLDFTGLPKVFTTSYSSLTWKEDDFAKKSRQFRDCRGSRILFVGSLAQMYKGPDVLLEAVARLRSKSVVEVILVGDGKHRPELENLAATLGVAGQVKFLGELPSGRAVREQMDQSSLFVMPSRTEGLPRAMIEAMACALPCIGTRIGGIPELLDEDDLVAPGDVEALAAKMEEVLNSPGRLTEMSARNLKRAQDYRPEVLESRRSEFYRFLRSVTEDWLREQRRVVLEKGAGHEN
jgi:glycosyltransferase involved in cell wall biosynthesis